MQNFDLYFSKAVVDVLFHFYYNCFPWILNVSNILFRFIKLQLKLIQRLVTLGNTVAHCAQTLQLHIAVSDETKSKTGGDFLTCGGCRRKYDLSDLTKFVQHKVLDCNKENSKLPKGERSNCLESRPDQ